MSAPPIGTVTLVFTDVQGSTALWEESTDAMRLALDVHNGIARTLLASCGGYEVKTEGDAFMVAFTDPSQAVIWCLRLQTALLTAPWPEALLSSPHATPQIVADTVLWRGLRVRMGVHTGTPDCRPSQLTGRMDYFGPMVNRAARVAGAASGGQILLSGDVFAAIEPHLPALGSPVTRPLGEYWLKGLKTPERLVEILPALLAARRFDKPGGVPATQALPAPAEFGANESEHLITMLERDQPSLDASGTLHALPGAGAMLDTSPRPALELEKQVRKKTKSMPSRVSVPLVIRRERRTGRYLLLVLLLVAAGIAAGPMRHDLPPPLRGFVTALWARFLPSYGKNLLLCSSTPSGARVRIGRTDYGPTPLVLENDFPAGTMQVVFTMPGYGQTTLLTQGGEQGALHAELFAAKAPAKKKR